MSKLLYTDSDNEYIELDAMGVNRWRNLILKEFDALEFSQYMGAEISQEGIDDYKSKHAYQLNNCASDQFVNINHMNDVLDRIPRSRIRIFSSWKLSSIINVMQDPEGRDLSANVRKSLIFTVPMISCACGSLDPAFLYWAPGNMFRKEDIVSFLALRNVSTTLDIKTTKCAACKPRLYPSVYSSEYWRMYSNCDPSTCRCQGCEG